MRSTMGFCFRTQPLPGFGAGVEQPLCRKEAKYIGTICVLLLASCIDFAPGMASVISLPTPTKKGFASQSHIPLSNYSTSCTDKTSAGREKGS